MVSKPVVTKVSDDLLYVRGDNFFDAVVLTSHGYGITYPGPGGGFSSYTQQLVDELNEDLVKGPRPRISFHKEVTPNRCSHELLYKWGEGMHRLRVLPGVAGKPWFKEYWHGQQHAFQTRWSVFLAVPREGPNAGFVHRVQVPHHVAEDIHDICVNPDVHGVDVLDPDTGEDLVFLYKTYNGVPKVAVMLGRKGGPAPLFEQEEDIVRTLKIAAAITL